MQIGQLTSRFCMSIGRQAFRTSGLHFVSLFLPLPLSTSFSVCPFVYLSNANTCYNAEVTRGFRLRCPQRPILYFKKDAWRASGDLQSVTVYNRPTTCWYIWTACECSSYNFSVGLENSHTHRKATAIASSSSFSSSHSSFSLLLHRRSEVAIYSFKVDLFCRRSLGVISSGIL